MRWGVAEYGYLLWLLPLLAALHHYFGRAAKRRFALFAAPELGPRLARGTSGRRSAAKLALFLGGVGLLVAALARPQFGEKTAELKRMGVDVVVALDTSWSMAAEDVAPNRLAAAKREAGRIAAALEGDRVGLLLFAGESEMECPLTSDNETFRMILRSAGHNSSAVGGTDIAGALRKGGAALRGSPAKSKIIVLLTDGEDHEGGVMEEVRRAASEGITVHAVGLGSATGAPIPVRDESGKLMGYRKDAAGQTVFTRLDAAALREIALAGGGLYVSAQGGALDLGPVIAAIEKAEKGEIGEGKFTLYEERFQWPLAGATLLFLLEAII